MCGIAGCFEYEDRLPVGKDALVQMLDSIRHRGPDDEGIMLSGSIAMGMRRLSIIDVDGGKQPISNESGQLTIVFNGEIYNYRELRQQLIARGHTLTTEGDTEVILHLYEDLGAKAVSLLRGMFAFAIWDERQKELFVARDRLGIKPLYYTQAAGRLIFASEIKAVLTYPGTERAMDLEALGHYLSLKYVPAPETMFAGVLSLPPGYAMLCGRKGPELSAYWDLQFPSKAAQKRREESYAEELESLLFESIKLHMISDVPLGAFLSGGVDSSLIVALMSQVTNSSVKTFSVGFDGGGAEKFSELPYARLVAESYGSSHHEILLTPDDLMSQAQRVVWFQDQPIADNACVANFMVSRLASQHVKVVLTGEGSDELFAGYARYAGEQASTLINLFPSSVKNAALRMGELLPGLRRPKAALVALCEADETKRYTNWFPLFDRNRKAALLTPQLLAQLSDPFAEDVFRKELNRTNTTDWLSRMLYVDTKLWLPDDLLSRADKTSMAWSLETRVPLLDHKLVEFAAGLPSNLKIRGLARKYLLKKVARKWIPSEVVNRKKQGFPMPFSIWFRGECREFVHDLLSSEVVHRRGLFNTTYIEKLLGEHDRGTADHGSLLWGLVSLELWQRSFLDSSY